MHHRQAQLRLFLLVWISGLPGIAALSWLALPELLSGRELPLPMWAVQAASAVQSALLLAVAAALGAALARRLGLAAPVFHAIAERGAVMEAARKQLLPGAVGAVLGALVLRVHELFTPRQLIEANEQFPPLPAAVRLLYGGVTEELLLRWGLMTFVLWIVWRVIQRGAGIPSAVLVSFSILISALLFGLGHLPAASAIAGSLTTESMAYIVLANASFGVIAGWLYWRVGLESAIIAHAGTHLLLLLFAR